MINFVESHKHLGIPLSYHGKWHTHIETILSSAYKMLGVMQKLKNMFSRQALNQMYISYVRPLLEYYSIVWDGCSEQDKTALERFQNETARNCYRIYKIYVYCKFVQRVWLGFAS